MAWSSPVSVILTAVRAPVRMVETPLRVPLTVDRRGQMVWLSGRVVVTLHGNGRLGRISPNILGTLMTKDPLAVVVDWPRIADPPPSVVQLRLTNAPGMGWVPPGQVRMPVMLRPVIIDCNEARIALMSWVERPTSEVTVPVTPPRSEVTVPVTPLRIWA